MLHKLNVILLWSQMSIYSLSSPFFAFCLTTVSNYCQYNLEISKLLQPWPKMKFIEVKWKIEVNLF